MKILICGGRDFYDQEYVNRAMRRLAQVYGRFDIIEGGQRTKDETGEIIGGADYWACMWGQANGFPVHTYKADWKNLGRAAGPIRNTRMLDEQSPNLVGFFPGGAGTKNMVDQATKRGIRCLEL